MSNVVKLETTLHHTFGKQTRNAIEDKALQLSAKEKEILNKWQELGFPKPYAVMNNKLGIIQTWQTYYKEFAKVKDDGKVRIQSKSLTKLYHKMQIAINQMESGQIQIRNTTATILPLLNEYKAYLKQMVERGTMNNATFETKSTLIRRLIEVINGNKHLLKTKVNNWTAGEVALIYNTMFEWTDSRNTKKLWLNLLRDAFDMAILFNKIPSDQGNVVVKWMKFIPNKKELFANSDSYHSELDNQMVLWDFEKMQNFLSSIQDPRFKLAMSIGVYCGLRVAEIFGLEFSDFRVKSNMVRISGQTCPIHRHKRHQTKTQKGLNRLIPLPPKLYQECIKYINGELNNPYAVSDKIMFPNCHKGVWDWHNSSSSRTALDLAMVGEYETPTKVRFHFFRHWIATQWIRNDIYPLYQVSYFLGHKNMSVTARTYTHVFQLPENKRCKKEDFLNGLLF